MSQELINIIRTLGANVEEIQNESSRDFDARMNMHCKDEYEEAKCYVKPSDNQIKLCDDLVDCGASFFRKEPHKESMSAANIFIKANYHLLRNPKPDSIRANPRDILSAINYRASCF